MGTNIDWVALKVERLNDNEKRLYEKALTEGYKNEVCPECGVGFLAHKSLIKCAFPTCPMKTPGGKSFLEMLKDSIPK